MKKINDLRLVSENELEMVVGGGSITRTVKGTLESVAVGVLTTLATTEIGCIYNDIGESNLEYKRTERDNKLRNLAQNIRGGQFGNYINTFGGKALEYHNKIVDFVRGSVVNAPIGGGDTAE